MFVAWQDWESNFSPSDLKKPALPTERSCCCRILFMNRTTQQRSISNDIVKWHMCSSTVVIQCCFFGSEREQAVERRNDMQRVLTESRQVVILWVQP